MTDRTPKNSKRPEGPEPRSSRKRFERFLDDWKRGDSKVGRTDEQTKQSEESTPPEGDANRDNLRRYLRWLWPWRWRIATLLALGLCLAALDAFWPLATGWIIDLVAPGNGRALPSPLQGVETLPGLTVLLILSFTSILAGRLLEVIRNITQWTLNIRLTQRLRGELFEHLLRLPIDDLEGMKTGGIVSRLSGDVDNTTALIQSAVIGPFNALARLLVVVSILAWIDWRLTLLTVCMLSIVGLVYYRAIRRVRPVFRQIRKERGEIDGRATEVFGGIRVVRSFSREKLEELQYAVGHHTTMRKTVWTRLKMNLLFFWWDLLLPMVSLMVVGLGSWFVMNGSLRIGEVVSMQILSFQVLNPVISLISSMTEMQRSLASMDRVYEVLDKEEEMPDRADAVSAPTAIESIHFDNVWFAYDAAKEPDDPTWVIRDFTFNVPGGSTVALVGASGAGKSTLTHLVARFHDPVRGAVTLNGKDLRDITLAGYRDLLGFVQQEIFLFDGTVEENISYGQRSASRAAVIEAAKAANAWEFIEGFPEGLDSVVGERGIKLSGGQRQRLAIARAMLADPAILVLDEATSNLDTESERLIQQSLHKLLQNRTTFVIAHRLDTIRHADQIVVLDHGQVVEIGTHDELLAKGPGHAYHDMIELQREGFVAIAAPKSKAGPELG